MTDDLVKRLPERLRLAGDWLNHDVKLTSQTIMHIAADRIEALEAALREKDKIAYIIDSHGMTHHRFTIVYSSDALMFHEANWKQNARAALGEKK